MEIHILTYKHQFKPFRIWVSIWKVIFKSFNCPQNSSIPWYPLKCYQFSLHWILNCFCFSKRDLTIPTCISNMVQQSLDWKSAALYRHIPWSEVHQSAWVIQHFSHLFPFPERFLGQTLNVQCHPGTDGTAPNLNFQANKNTNTRNDLHSYTLHFHFKNKHAIIHTNFPIISLSKSALDDDYIILPSRALKFHISLTPNVFPLLCAQTLHISPLN